MTIPTRYGLTEHPEGGWVLYKDYLEMEAFLREKIKAITLRAEIAERREQEAKR